MRREKRGGKKGGKRKKVGRDDDEEDEEGGGVDTLQVDLLEGFKGVQGKTVGKEKSSCDKSQYHNRDGWVSFE